MPADVKQNLGRWMSNGSSGGYKASLWLTFISLLRVIFPLVAYFGVIEVVSYSVQIGSVSKFPVVYSEQPLHLPGIDLETKSVAR